MGTCAFPACFSSPWHRTCTSTKAFGAVLARACTVCAGNGRCADELSVRHSWAPKQERGKGPPFPGFDETVLPGLGLQARPWVLQIALCSVQTSKLWPKGTRHGSQFCMVTCGDLCTRLCASAFIAGVLCRSWSESTMSSLRLPHLQTKTTANQLPQRLTPTPQRPRLLPPSLHFRVLRSHATHFSATQLQVQVGPHAVPSRTGSATRHARKCNTLLCAHGSTGVSGVSVQARAQAHPLTPTCLGVF